MREAPPLQFLDPTHVRLGRRTLLYFAGSNYLGLSFDPSVRRALSQAARTGPLQSGASRATTGEEAACRHFERRLARFFGQPEATYLPAGYLAPLAAGHALRDQVTHVLLDDASHSCVGDAARLTGRPVLPFPHGDTTALGVQLRQLPRGAVPLVACDGLRGTGGGITPVDQYLALLRPRGWLLVDDAHGGGVVGPGGRGTCALLGMRDDRVVQTVSLAKAFGVAGGAVLASTAIGAAIRTRAAAFVGSTAPLLPVMAALEAALDRVRRSDGVTRLQSNARLLHDQLPRHPAIRSDPRSPVTAILPADPTHSEKLRRSLLRAGIFPSFIRYPGGPEGGFLRLAVLAGHTPAEIELLARTVARALPAPASSGR